MNMLEAQNTLVSILNPTVLTWYAMGGGGMLHMCVAPCVCLSVVPLPGHGPCAFDHHIYQHFCTRAIRAWYIEGRIIYEVGFEAILTIRGMIHASNDSLTTVAKAAGLLMWSARSAHMD